MLTVRDAELADAPAIRDLLEVLGYPAGVDAVASEIAAVRPSGRAGLIVACDGAAVVGFASYDLWRAFAEGAWVCRLSALATSPNCQRRGVGRMLVTEVERRARTAGCSRMEISSGRRAGREAAHRFYPSLGYADSCAHHAVYEKELGR